MHLRRLACGVCSISLVACSGGHPREPETPIGVSDEVELTEYEEEENASENPPEDVVVKAARPFMGYRPADDRTFSAESLLTHLAAADAICVGEQHDDPADHYAQLRAIEGLLDRRRMRGFELGVGLEMVRARYQRQLSMADRVAILGDELEEEVEWQREWGFPFQYYRPQLLWAWEGGADLLALGVDRDLTRDVARNGLGGVSAEHARALPELDLEVEEHRQLFDQMMTEHPSSHGGSTDMDNYYAAQVVWDEAMAALSADWLSDAAPMRKLIVLAGVGHCHKTAIPGRIERRGRFDAVSVLPMNDETEYAERRAMAAAYDYHLVFQDGDR